MDATISTAKPDLSPRLTRVLNELEALTRDIQGDEEMMAYLIEAGEISGPKGA